MTVPCASTSGDRASDGLPPAKSKSCKVEGCMVNLHALNRPYCVKKCLCLQHLKADAVKCKGQRNQLWRFCQQCGKLQELELFQGKKRSCSASLEKRRLLDAAQPRSSKRAQQRHRPLRRSSCAVSTCSADQDCCAASLPDTAAASQEHTTSNGCTAYPSAEQLDVQLETQLESSILEAVQPAPLAPAAVHPQATGCTEQLCMAVSSCTAAASAATVHDAAAFLAEAWWQDQQQMQQEDEPDAEESGLESMLVDSLSKTIAGATVDAVDAADYGCNAYEVQHAQRVAGADAAEEELEDMIAEELAAAGLALTPNGAVQQMQLQQQLYDVGSLYSTSVSHAVAAAPCCYQSTAQQAVSPAAVKLVPAAPALFPAATPALLPAMMPAAAESSVHQLAARMLALRQQVQATGQMLNKLHQLQQLQLGVQAPAGVAAVAFPASQLWNGGGSICSSGAAACYGC